MAKQRGSRRKGKAQPKRSDSVAHPLRIIGGHLGGRRIEYSGDPRTRPMKLRVREAVFNLVGLAVKGTHAIDLFAGTGALGLEAISRGALSATFIERHAPSVRLIQENVNELAIDDRCEVCFGDTFLWTRQFPDWQSPDKRPWLVLCSPPYDFYSDRLDDMLGLLRELHRRSPEGSIFVVESDRRLDFQVLDEFGTWDVRTYSPAVVGLHKRPDDVEKS